MWNYRQALVMNEKMIRLTRQRVGQLAESARLEGEIKKNWVGVGL